MSSSSRILLAQINNMSPKEFHEWKQQAKQHGIAHLSEKKPEHKKANTESKRTLNDPSSSIKNNPKNPFSETKAEQKKPNLSSGQKTPIIQNEPILKDKDDVKTIIEKMSEGDAECKRLLEDFSCFKKYGIIESALNFWRIRNRVHDYSHFIQAMHKLDQLGIRGKVLADCYWIQYSKGCDMRFSDFLMAERFYDAIMSNPSEVLDIAEKINCGEAPPRPPLHIEREESETREKYDSGAWMGGNF